MSVDLLKQGDKVVMHTCIESEGKNSGKIWTCRTDECITGVGCYKQSTVFLEGYSGSFSTQYLQKVELSEYISAIDKQSPKDVIKTDSSSQACPNCNSDVNSLYCPKCGQRLAW